MVPSAAETKYRGRENFLAKLKLFWVIFMSAAERRWDTRQSSREREGLAGWVTGPLSREQGVYWEGGDSVRPRVCLGTPGTVDTRGREGPTVDFIGHQDTRDLRPELPKLRVPGAQVPVGDLPLHIKHLQ